MKIAEAEAIMAKPENAGRTAVYVYEDGDDFVVEWAGREVRAGNPFGLDSRLTGAGVPVPRNLFLIDSDAAHEHPKGDGNE